MALAERDTIITLELRSSAPGLYTFTRAQYLEMSDAGWFLGQRVERIEGVIREKSPISSQHMTTVMLATRALGKVFGDNYAISVQNSLRLGEHSDPEPDIAVLEGDIRSFTKTTPSSAVLIVEVSQSTLAFDRTKKASLYAEAGIEDYWIINLNAVQIEVHREPNRSPEGLFGYNDVSSYLAGQTIAPLAAPEATLAVSDLLP